MIKGRTITALLVMTLVLGLALPAVAAPPQENPGKGPPELEQIVFIHYLDDSHPANPNNPLKPDKPGRPGKEEEDPTLYYELLNLKLPEDVTVYIEGVSEEDPEIAAILTSFSTWEVETGSVLFDTIHTTTGDMFGIMLNDYNTVSFGDLDNPNIIGVTSLWSFRGKPPRTIVEWDIVLNTDFTWDTDGNPDDMDIQNIATHEVGHVVGLADLYADDYLEQTMYGYSHDGETKKRDLLAGDILGAQSLYGSPQP